MEMKLKERWGQNRVLQTLKDSGRSLKRITGMTSGNMSAIPIESIAYEQSRAYLVYKAELEAKRAQASAEAQRRSFR